MEELWRSFIEPRAGSCFGGVFWGIVSENPSSSSSIAMGFSADRKKEVVDRLRDKSKFRNLGAVFDHQLSHFVHQFFNPNWLSVMGTCIIRCSLKSLWITSTMSHNFIGKPFKIKNLQMLFLTLGNVLNQAKNLPSLWGCCFALKGFFWVISWN